MITQDHIVPHNSRAERLASRLRFQKARKAEKEYGRKLRKIAIHIGDIVKSFTLGSAVQEGFSALTATLNKYADLLAPWARVTANRMLADVANRDKRAWLAHGRTIGRELRKEIESAPTGRVMRSLLDEQVELITSMPRKAAERVQRVALEAYQSGVRAEDVVAKIMRTGAVTESRARMIARTEVSRAATGLTEARAEHVGSEGYIWRTSMDVSVRDSHKKMEGQYVPWDSPPELDGMVGHAGALPNCRCYPEPVLPDEVA